VRQRTIENDAYDRSTGEVTHLFLNEKKTLFFQPKSLLARGEQEVRPIDTARPHWGQSPHQNFVPASLSYVTGEQRWTLEA
jgi:hypothetical protein